mmetsp:Transcript_17511/g.33201  ORF Transcript_17511/g.33201 Transcript_17511/m.33201 type:complete len:89 (-) Transcript_17511:1370-1636(-)
MKIFNAVNGSLVRHRCAIEREETSRQKYNSGNILRHSSTEVSFCVDNSVLPFLTLNVSGSKLVVFKAQKSERKTSLVSIDLFGFTPVW